MNISYSNSIVETPLAIALSILVTQFVVTLKRGYLPSRFSENQEPPSSRFTQDTEVSRSNHIVATQAIATHSLPTSGGLSQK